MFVRVKFGRSGKVPIRFCLLLCSLVTSEISVSALSGQSNGYFKLSNHITAIEDKTSEPPGFMVMTADHNYAIYSPRLAEFHWSSVTVNGAQVFITTTSNSTLSTGLFELNELERDFIAEVRGEFTQNLAGLKLSRAVTSEPAYSLSGRQPNLMGANYLPGDELSYAEQAIRLIDLIDQTTNITAAKAYQEVVQPQPGTQVLGNNETQAQAPLRSNSRKLEQFIKQRPRNFQKGRRKGARPPARFPGSVAAYPQRAYQAAPSGHCSRKQANFNYYNLYESHLASSLCGDIYNFDMRCQILDVYSNSVSIQQQTGSSALYRDENYFALARSDLPARINRFFLVGEKVFFVYHDRSVLLKFDWLLDAIELDLVVRARRQLRSITNWRTKQAKASSSSNNQDNKQQQSQPATDNERAGSEKRVEGGRADQTTTTTPATNDK